MKKWNLTANVLSVALVGLAACSGHSRPEMDQAKSDFQKLYQETEILEMRISEDEVIARSFEVVYRKSGNRNQEN
jgi:hypothetical protein